MRNLLVLAAFVLLLAGCAPGSYLDRLGDALVDRAPDLASDISADPSPFGIGSAVFQWIAGGLAAAAAGGAAVGGTKLVRRNRRAAAAVLVDRTRDDTAACDLARLAGKVDPPLVP